MCRILCIAAVFVCFLPMFLENVEASASSTFGSRLCRYSVRDVGFVNVHPQPWRLSVLEPDGLTEAAQLQFRESLQEQLQFSNISLQWIVRDSDEGRQWIQTVDKPIANGVFQARIEGSDSLSFPLVTTSNIAEITNELTVLLESPARDRILNQSSSSLCVFLVVGCGDSNLDSKVEEVAKLAAEQMEKQMWMLEKATRVGPKVTVIPASKRHEERWLLRSLDLDPKCNVPQFAIVYGQGRRLGDALVGDEIRPIDITQLASLCGQSCECDLDRLWLYGTQMIHRWTEERAAVAEESLTFDPGSALVLAEVNGILQRTGDGSRRSDDSIDNGLIIRDFSQPTRPSSVSQNKSIAANANTESPAREASVETRDNSKSNAIASSTTEANSSDETGELDEQSSVNRSIYPVLLLIVAGCIVLTIALLTFGRNRE